MCLIHSRLAWVLRTTGIVPVVLIFLIPFTNTSFAGVYTNGDEGYITNVLSANSNFSGNEFVNSGTGAFEYTYDLVLPAGRGASSPKLALEYNSQQHSDTQIFGYGWDISIPYIRLINKIGVDQLYNASSTQYYVSSFDGEIVSDGTSNGYRAKFETNTFNNYSKVGNTWELNTKAGLTYTFGQSTTSREADPVDGSHIAKWMLSKVEDQNGNYTQYTYTTENGLVYPDEITYTHYSASEPLFRVEFVSSSTNAFTDYSSGFALTRNKIISEIKIYEGTTLINKYSLAYSKGINTKRDLLESITRTGYEGGSTSFPPVTFDYEGSQLPSWDFTGNPDFPEPLSDLDNGVRFGDLNGDGLIDVVRYQYENEDGTITDVRRVHINLGNGNWEIDADWNWDDISVPFFFHREEGSDHTRRDMGSRLIDVNGDGRDDFIAAYNCHKAFSPYTDCDTFVDYPNQLPDSQVAVYINDGSGFIKDESWTGVQPMIRWNINSDKFFNTGVDLLDVNGDGLPDFFQAVSIDNTAATHPSENLASAVWLNNGHGWELSNWEMPAFIAENPDQYSMIYSFQDMGTRFADVNGDGLVDVLRGYQEVNGESNPDVDEQSVYINNGSGWATTTDWSIDIEFVNPDDPSVTHGYHLADVNGDRLPDIIHANDHNNDSYDFRLNTGSGWTDITYELPFFLNQGYRKYNNRQALIDFDGDTLVDSWSLGYTDTETTQSSGGDVVYNDSDIPDLITKITHEQGGITAVTYDGYLATTQATYTSVGSPLSNPVVVTEKAKNSGFSATTTESFSYQQGSFYFASTSPSERKFAGFGQVIKSTDKGKEITYYHQGNGAGTTTEEGIDDEALINRVYGTEIRDLSDNLYQLSRYNYATSSLGNGSTFVKLESDLTLIYDGDGDEKAKATEYAYDINLGSILTQNELGEVDGSTDGSYSDVGSDKRTTTYTYATSSNLVLPATITLKDNTNTTITETRNYYDNQSLGSVTLGNLTKQAQWISGGDYAETIHAYNSYGLVTSSTDPLDNVTTYLYDDFNLYPATTTNALGQATARTYNYSSGQILTETDPNGNTSEHEYDGLDRLIAEYKTDPHTGSLVQKTAVSYTDTPGAIAASRNDYLSSTNLVGTYTYFDGFGRPVQTRTEAESGYVVIDTAYNKDGLVGTKSLPYEDTGSARTGATTNIDLLTIYTHDPLNRLLTLTTALGTTTHAYDQWIETITDPLGNEKDFSYDAFGRLGSVVEYNDSTPYTTTYYYRADNLLATVMDASGNERDITYDGRGLRLTLEDLHDSADGTFGTWSFTYDAGGNLATTTDPKNQVIVRNYDALNRILTEDFSGSAGTELTYTYDSCTKGIGSLCTASSTDVHTDYTYTHNGLLASETKLIEGQSYTTAYEYDRQGNKTLVTYPDDSEVRYTYNDANQIEMIEQREVGGSFVDIISDFDYGPHGLVTYQLYGNGASTTKIYDENELYRLKTLITTSTTTLGTGGSGAELALIEAEFPLMFSTVEDQSLSTLVTDNEVTTISESEPIESPIEEEVSTTSISTATADDDKPLLENDIEITSTTTEEGIYTATSSIDLGPESSNGELIVSEALSTSSVEISTPKNEFISERIKFINDHAEKLNFSALGDGFILETNQAIDKDQGVEVMAMKDRPEIRLKKWNGEVDLGIKYNGIEVVDSGVHGNNLMRWVNASATKEVHAYPLKPATGMEDGGFEIEVLLTEKSKSNVFEFEIEGYEDLDFFYQPELTQEEIEQGVDRPENVIGSYAVYHKEKKNHIIGDTNYATGKVFHIYRPKIVDADKNEIWGQLDYVDGVLSVTVPQVFLETAIYPVRVDPTFGYTSVGASQVQRGGGTGKAWAELVTLTEDGDVESISVRMRADSGTRSAIGGFFSGSAGSVGSLVSNETSELTGISTSEAWWNIPYASPEALTAGTYFIAVMTGNGGIHHRYDTVGSQRDPFDETTYSSTNISGAFPSPTYTVFSNNPRYSIYATYSVAATNTSPLAPTELLAEGQTNPSNILDTTPEFSAIYNDSDTGDTATHYQIQVSTSSSFTNTFWDTGSTTIASSTPEGNRIADISYGGTTLASSTTYYWRIKFWDDGGAEGAWSTTTASFSLDAGSEPQEGWYDPNWLNRVEITIDSDNVASTLSNFPVYLDLSTLPSGAVGEMNSDCGDIRVTKSDGTTELAREVVSCDIGAETGELHFLADTISSSSDTSFYIYYNNSGATDYTVSSTYGAENVWSDYVAVYHLNEDPVTGAPQYIDVSGNGNSGSAGNMETADSVTGKLGKAANFDGSPERITIPDATDFDWNSSLTLSAWALTDTWSTDGTISAKNGGSTSEPLLWADEGVDDFTFALKLSSGFVNTSVGGSYTSRSTGQWYHTVGTYDGSSVKMYVNGVANYSASHSGTVTRTSSGVGIGGEHSGTRYLDGRVDEVRYTTLSRNEAWVDAEYVNQSSPLTFYSVGSAQSSGSTTPPTFPIFREAIQHLTYTYDAVGNITQIVDSSDTDSAGITTYVYDDLYRLTSASTTMASTTDYVRTYSYDALGNILNKSDQGSYSYEGNVGGSYANPHAVTEIATVTYAYDNNGNLASTTNGLANTWDYHNRLQQSSEGGVVVDYEYDHAGQRVLKDNSTTTTIYPSSLYEMSGTTTTKHIYAGDMLIATIEEDTPAPKIYYNHLDHLNSTNIVTGEDGYVNQLLAYYPFGDTRIDNQYDVINQSNRFTGHDYDSETELSYMGARYYNGEVGRFTAQDPVFLSVGNVSQLKVKADISFDTYLKSPQTHNSYSYTANNPIKYVDKNGEFLHIAVGALGGGLIGMGAQGVSDFVSGNYSGSQEYAGAFTGGAVVGGIAAGTGGLSLVPMIGAGLAGGTANGLVSEGLKVADGTQNTMNTGNLTEKALLGGATAGIPGLKIQGVTVGKGSFQAVQNQINTKFANGIINSMTPSTAGKIFAAQFANNAPGETFSAALQQISGKLGAIQSTLNKLKEKSKK